MREVVLHLVLAAALGAGSVFASRTNRRVELLTVLVLLATFLPPVAATSTFPEQSPSFAMLRIEAGFLFVQVPLVLLVLAIHAPAAWRFRRALAVVSLAVFALVGIDAFLYEPHALVIRREVVHSPRIETPLRIVVLSDVQTDAPGAYERRVMREAAALHPDLLLLPGDYIQLPEGPEYQSAATELGALFDTIRSPLGTHAVRGNVEHADYVADVFGKTGVHAYDRTTRVALGSIDLVALSFADSFDPRLTIPSSGRFQVVFGHGPDFMLGDVRADLLIAGHTHGGQVQIPFFGPPMTLTTVPRRWAAGGHRESPRGRHLDISRGIGMERDSAPRFRFFCRPEIVVIDLRP